MIRRMHRTMVGFAGITTLQGHLVFLILSVTIILAACSQGGQSQAEAGEEAIARTEFTERIENFFEYEPLKAGRSSQFLIHLTDLSDGSPVEKAEVTLSLRQKKNSAEMARIVARIGKVTGIYVADVTFPQAGDYDIEFHIKTAKLDERQPLSDFHVK